MAAIMSPKKMDLINQDDDRFLRTNMRFLRRNSPRVISVLS